MAGIMNLNFGITAGAGAGRGGSSGAATLKLVLVFTGGSGSVTVPANSSFVTVEAIGGGGVGYLNNVSPRGGRGGGTYAATANLSVTGGSSVVYYSVGGSETQSWVNVGTNSAPSSNTTGTLAPQGQTATPYPGSGSYGTPIGTLINRGGDGVEYTGGGGGGASTAGSGPTAGTDTTGLSPSAIMGGGTGGNQDSGAAPGGGGGGRNQQPNGPYVAGAGGRVRLVFYG